MAAVDIPMVGVVVIPAEAAVAVADTPEVGATEVVEVTVAVAAIDRVRDIRMSRAVASCCTRSEDKNRGERGRAERHAFSLCAEHVRQLPQQLS